MNGTGAGQLRLSGRLSLIADVIRTLANAYGQVPRLADIGCDHALVPVALLRSGDIAFAHASDVREGPLRAARENAVRFGTEGRMRFLQADGLQGLGEGEAEICVIAGMGGELIRSILETGDAAAKGISTLVLSPHTRQEAVREYLAGSAFRIADEQLAKEDGKYYPVIAALSSAAPATLRERVREHLYAEVADALADKTGCDATEAEAVCIRFGPLLLERRDPVLEASLERRRKRLCGILEQARDRGAAPEEALEQMRLVTYALQWYAGGKEGEAP